jgi:hypothetical protein
LALKIDGVPLYRQGYAIEIAGTRLFLVSNDGGLITSVAGLTDPGYAVLVGQQYQCMARFCLLMLTLITIRISLQGASEAVAAV